MHFWLFKEIMGSGSSYYPSNSYSESSSLAGIEAGRTRLLNSTCEKFKDYCIEIENQVRIEAAKVFNLFKRNLGKQIEIVGQSANIKLISQFFDDFLSEVSINNLVMECLTRENPKCIKILQKEAGEERKDELQQFAAKSLQKALEKNLKDFDKTIEKAFLLINDVIKNKTCDEPQIEKEIALEIEKLKMPLLLIKRNESALKNKLALLESFIDSVEPSTEHDRIVAFQKMKTLSNMEYYESVCS
jgi:hypothetical protein